MYWVYCNKMMILKEIWFWHFCDCRESICVCLQKSKQLIMIIIMIINVVGLCCWWYLVNHCGLRVTIIRPILPDTMRGRRRTQVLFLIMSWGIMRDTLTILGLVEAVVQSHLYKNSHERIVMYHVTFKIALNYPLHPRLDGGLANCACCLFGAGTCQNYKLRVYSQRWIQCTKMGWQTTKPCTTTEWRGCSLLPSKNWVASQPLLL